MAANFLAKLNFAFTRPQIYLAVNCWGSQIYKFTHGVTEHTHLQTCKECAATILHVNGLGGTCQGHRFEHFPKKKAWTFMQWMRKLNIKLYDIHKTAHPYRQIECCQLHQNNAFNSHITHTNLTNKSEISVNIYEYDLHIQVTEDKKYQQTKNYTLYTMK